MKRHLPHFLLSLAGVALSIFLAEFLIRVFETKFLYPPLEMALRTFPGEPRLLDPDPLLGWKKKEGRYLIPPYTLGGPEITVTVWPDDRRATGVTKNTRSRVGLVGCSYTFGWAISDWETLGWKLQQEFPSIEFLNYGTNGYGTYQSLLLLEKIYSEKKPSMDLVFYGFVDTHEDRNVANATWLKMLSEHSHRGHVEVPYCAIDSNGKLERHIPDAYTRWPWDRKLRTIALAENFYTRLRTRKRNAEKRKVTELLLQEMNALITRQDSKLVVLLLRGNRYQSFLQERGISFLNCQPPDIENPRYYVKEEGHPNGELNSIWAKCISNFLRTENRKSKFEGSNYFAFGKMLER